jgi:hypothetical protein
MLLPIVWGLLGIATVGAAVRSRKSRRALNAGRLIVATLYMFAGALVNLGFLARGDTYRDFAKASYIPFVRDTWRSLVVPHVEIFITLLIVFEAAVGASVLMGKRWTQGALIAAIAFHVALMSFGWGFFIWSIPMIGALGTLLRGELNRDKAMLVPIELARAA